MFTTAPRQLWVPRPGAPIVWGNGERINAAGYRGPVRPIERTPGVPRILVLGESCTFGYGVAYPDTFPAQLESSMRAHGRDVEVIDAGVVGYTVTQGLERYRAFARAYHADVVVEAFGEVNEHIMAEGVPDAQKIEAGVQEGSAWEEIVRLARSRVLTLHLAAKIVDRMSNERVLRREVEFRRKAVENELRAHMGEIDWAGHRRVPLDDFEKALRTLAQEVKADGAAFVMLSPPRRQAAEEQAPVLALYTRAIEELARRDGIPLADGVQAFRDAEARGVAPDELFHDSWHPSRAGHRVLAEALAQRIEAITTLR